MRNNMTILITGATGFVGSSVARRLLADGFRIIAVRRGTSSLKRLADIATQMEWCNIETNDLDTLLSNTSHSVGAIIHIATQYGRANSNPFDVFQTNVAFPMALMYKAISAGVKVFINTDTFFNVPDIRYGYLSTYTLSKRHFLEWGKQVASDVKCRFVNMRLFHVYGPSDSPEKFVPSLVRACLKGGSVPLTAGTQGRDFIHVEDVAEAYRTVVRAEVAEDSSGYCHYDIGTGHAVSIREFAERVNAACGKHATLAFGALPTRDGEFNESKADTKSIFTLGWRPIKGLDDSIRVVCAEIANQMFRTPETEERIPVRARFPGVV